MAKYMEWENFSVSLESIVREVMHVVGYLEVQKTAIYKCIDQHEKGRCFNLLAPWPERGRPVYVNDKEAEVLAERIRNNVGEKNTHDIVA